LSSLQIIREYSQFQHHRTGSHEDRAVCSWLSEILVGQGLKVVELGYEFPRYQAKWLVQSDDVPVAAIPVFYSATAEVDFADVPVLPLLLDDWHESVALEQIQRQVLRSEKAGHGVAIFATQSANQAVYALNVGVDFQCPLPVLLVGADSANTASHFNGSLQGKITQGRSSNLIAYSASEHLTPELIITTPISGWFHCAAERGAGIAVVLELITRLKDRYRLQIVMTTGHELHHLGTDAVQAQLDIPEQVPVLHIGSCVGVANADMVLSSNQSAQSIAELSRIFTNDYTLVVQRDVRQPAEGWPGESRNWVNAERRILSLAGSNRHFHTPLDTYARINIEPLVQIVENLEQGVAVLLETKSS
jgi:hypothetical protein